MPKPKLSPIRGTVSKTSSQQQRKWRTQEKLQKDMRQHQLFVTQEGTLDTKENPNKYAVLQPKALDPYKDTVCPYCLKISPTCHYLVSSKGKNKGYNKERGKCPKCDTGLMFNTLTKMRIWCKKENLNGPKAYAKWVFDGKRSFWERIKPFHAGWQSQLKAMGWSNDFWEEYKRLRGDNEKDAEEKRINDLADAYEADFQ